MGNLMVQNVLPTFLLHGCVVFCPVFFFSGDRFSRIGDKSMFLQCETSGILGKSELSAAMKKIKFLLAKAYFTFS